MSLRRTGIEPMSDRRRAELAAAGNPYPTSTLTVRKPVERKPATRKASRDTGPDRATVDAVIERDGHQCVRCGGACWGERGRDWSVQHRRARGRGGSRRPDTNAPQNLITVCGSATTACHGWIESHPAEAKASGWAVASTVDPLAVPVVHSLHGFVWLTPDGGWTSTRPTTAEEAT